MDFGLENYELDPPPPKKKIRKGKERKEKKKGEELHEPIEALKGSQTTSDESTPSSFFVSSKIPRTRVYVYK